MDLRVEFARRRQHRALPSGAGVRWGSAPTQEQATGRLLACTSGDAARRVRVCTNEPIAMKEETPKAKKSCLRKLYSFFRHVCCRNPMAASLVDASGVVPV